MARDKYSIAASRLKRIKDPTDFRHAVRMAWNDPNFDPNGCLFKYVSPTGICYAGPKIVGCLTQVHCKEAVAFDENLTRAIRADKRLPDSWEGITPENLDVFVEWQRKVDTYFSIIQLAV